MVLDDQGLQTKYREVIEKMVLARSEQEKINIQALLSSATSENLSKRPKSTKVSFPFIKTVIFIIQSQFLETRFKCLVLLYYNYFGPSKLFWSCSNCFGRVQIILVRFKLYFSGLLL